MDYNKEYWQKHPNYHKEDTFIKIKDLTSIDLDFEPKSIIDLGCGAGFLSSLIYNTFKPKLMFGADISKEAINIAKNNDKRIKFIQTDLTTYKPNLTFDLAIIADLIEHIKKDASILKQFSTYSRKLLLKIPIENTTLNHLLKNIGISDELKKLEIKYGHIHHYNTQEVTELLNDSGWKIDKISIRKLSKRSSRFNEILRKIGLPFFKLNPQKSIDFFGGFLVVLCTSKNAINFHAQH